MNAPESRSKSLEIPFNAYQELKQLRYLGGAKDELLEIPFNAYQELKLNGYLSTNHGRS